jgi:hypothetical protein
VYHQALQENVTKLAFLVEKTNHKNLNSTFLNSLVTMKGERLTKILYVKFTSRNVLIKHFDFMMERLLPAGISQHLWDSGQSDVYRYYDEEETDSLRILALSDVEYGFVIWLATFPIPIIAFICELYSLKFKRMRRKIAGLIEFLLLLRARMSVYHG